MNRSPNVAILVLFTAFNSRRLSILALSCFRGGNKLTLAPVSNRKFKFVVGS